MPFFFFTPEDLAEYDALLTQKRLEPTGWLPLADRPIASMVEMDKREVSPGRRLRVFSMLVQRLKRDGQVTYRWEHYGPKDRTMFEAGQVETYGEALREAEADFGIFTAMSRIPLRVRYGIPQDTEVFEAIPDDYVHANKRDPELHPALQDVARLLITSLTEACEAFSNPDLYYPGIDEGIEPVTDEHVELVIWGAQRELNREPRRQKKPAPLSELPWRIQRAYAERRRYIYQCYGIGRAQYETNRFSLWDIPEEPDWVPPWVQE